MKQHRLSRSFNTGKYNRVKFTTRTIDLYPSEDTTRVEVYGFIDVSFVWRALPEKLFTYIEKSNSQSNAVQMIPCNGKIYIGAIGEVVRNPEDNNDPSYAIKLAENKAKLRICGKLKKMMKIIWMEFDKLSQEFLQYHYKYIAQQSNEWEFHYHMTKSKS